MPILTLGFFCLQLGMPPPPPCSSQSRTDAVYEDRGNIANALTDNFVRLLEHFFFRLTSVVFQTLTHLSRPQLKNVGINQDQFNVGQQMLSLGIVLFEIPSNMILYRVGPGKWLTLQLFLFGFVSLFQAFQHGYGAFISTRLLLGMTESGFIPGGLYTLSTWCASNNDLSNLPRRNGSDTKFPQTLARKRDRKSVV